MLIITIFISKSDIIYIYISNNILISEFMSKFWKIISPNINYYLKHSYYNNNNIKTFSGYQLMLTLMIIIF